MHTPKNQAYNILFKTCILIAGRVSVRYMHTATQIHRPVIFQLIKCSVCLLVWLGLATLPSQVHAEALASSNLQSGVTLTSKLGVHILHSDEVSQVRDVVNLTPEDEIWQYVTVPFTLDDVSKQAQWQQFFQKAAQNRLIPLVRLATRYENGSWQRFTRKDIVDELTFLDQFEWPTDKRHIIIANEVNHAAEWGGSIDSGSYAQTLEFAADWAHTQDHQYIVLPAALDLAAPNGGATQEAFAYLEQLYSAHPELIDKLDAWNSHSYPNPSFSAPPTALGKQSLRGYQSELSFITRYTDKTLPVYITETGWQDSAKISRRLADYYTYALQNIWSDSRVVAVTPFLLKGSPGPFATFSFLDEDNQPTSQYRALQTALRRVLNAPQLSYNVSSSIQN